MTTSTPVPLDHGDPIDNAKTVLRILQAAGLRRTLQDTAIGDAIELWAEELSPYPISTLEEAAKQWVETPDDAFPSIGEFLRQVRYVVSEQKKHASNDDQAHDVAGCEECGIFELDDDGVSERWVSNARYVTVIDSTEQVETWASKKAHRRSDGTDDGREEDREHMEIHHRSMRPCSRCLPERFHLYETGHFTQEHKDHGGCERCRHYHWPYKFKDPRTSKGRVGT